MEKTRYIIVLFMGVDANRSGQPVGYLLKKLRQNKLYAAAVKDEL